MDTKEVGCGCLMVLILGFIIVPTLIPGALDDVPKSTTTNMLVSKGEPAYLGMGRVFVIGGVLFAAFMAYSGLKGLRKTHLPGLGCIESLIWLAVIISIIGFFAVGILATLGERQ